MNFLRASWFPLLLGLIILIVILNQVLFTSVATADEFTIPNNPISADDWQAPDINALPNDEEANRIRYGRELMVNTALFFGPKGKLGAITNGMNCQNCHVDGGTVAFAGCFSAVASTYPRYRERSGRIESIEFRINDCMLRSLNGHAIDSSGSEMKAMVAYLKWLGKDVPKNKKPKGAGLEDLAFLGRAANPDKGKAVFASKCVSCHGDNGQGLLNHDSSFYLYPPLWGPNSFNVSAGLYRISRLASFVKNNMPFGQASHDAPQLRDDEAWDVAAYVLSQPRPEKFFSEDWPKKQTKPVDYPYGPYADNFSETQHKYGPFTPIQEARNKK
ncbi:MAG: c-type cytochrome [Bacteroidetes bacterium]|nr:MAG: c-type cytochrome [Bacteroidota bacterium]